MEKTRVVELAVKGTPAFEDWDENAQRAWEWKDAFPRRGLACYGKFIRRKPAFISLRALPFFLAAVAPGMTALEAAETSHEPWRVLHLALYQEGQLSVEARNVADHLAEDGPAAAGALRSLDMYRAHGVEATAAEAARLFGWRRDQVVRAGW